MTCSIRIFEKLHLTIVLPIQKNVMQRFDLYSRYSTLIAIIFLIKISFPCPQVSSEFTFKHFFFPPLTTQEPIPEHPLQFVPLVFEILAPDILDIVICFASSSSSSELITISSHAFSCS